MIGFISSTCSTVGRSCSTDVGEANDDCPGHEPPYASPQTRTRSVMGPSGRCGHLMPLPSLLSSLQLMTTGWIQWTGRANRALSEDVSLLALQAAVSYAIFEGTSEI